MTVDKLLIIWLCADIIAIDLLSRRDNGVNDLLDLYDDFKKLKTVWAKIYVVIHLFIFLPLTIAPSIFKLIKKNKNE